jgi:hypothetical protein
VYDNKINQEIFLVTDENIRTGGFLSSSDIVRELKLTKEYYSIKDNTPSKDRTPSNTLSPELDI